MLVIFVVLDDVQDFFFSRIQESFCVEQGSGVETNQNVYPGRHIFRRADRTRVVHKTRVESKEDFLDRGIFERR